MSDRPAIRFLHRDSPPHIVTLVLLSGLSALAMNIFLPSLPNMAAWFGTDYRLMQLSVPIYLAVNAVLQIVVGPLSDRYGRRPVVLGSMAVFIVATVGTLLAPTLDLFLFFRMCQAAVVAAMVLSRAVVRDMVPQDQAASMIGYVTMGMALVPMVGPMVGGALDQMFGWKASFVFLLACGLAVCAITWADLGETATRRSSSFAAQFREYPQMLGARRFWGYCGASAFGAGAFFAFLGGAPWVGTEVFGLSSAAVGLYLGAPALGYMAGNFVTGRLSVRAGTDALVLAGAIVNTAGLVASLAAFSAGLQHPAAFFAFFAFVGFGNGMLLPNAMAGMLSVRPHLAGTASGLGGAIMIGGGAALSALAGALLVPGAGPYPLLLIMLASAAAAIPCALYIIRRRRQVTGR
ncbi:MAG: multidrug effflux MFS transporter [Rhodobacteraceae bacterium]|jgi:DHA1 family bicyclomycin/chloramphenicol resistance-like MFS transporter|nr:multidrug effflux MFS transporter [Paracoccaceae bacterium]